MPPPLSFSYVLEPINQFHIVLLFDIKEGIWKQYHACHKERALFVILFCYLLSDECTPSLSHHGRHDICRAVISYFCLQRFVCVKQFVGIPHLKTDLFDWMDHGMLYFVSFSCNGAAKSKNQNNNIFYGTWLNDLLEWYLSIISFH